MERVLIVIFLLLTLTNATIDVTKLNIHLPGWKAQLVSSAVPDIRQIALTPDESIIFAGSSASNVFAVPIINTNNIVTQNGNVTILLKNQIWPHGVAFDPTTNDLYVSTNHTSVVKLPNIINNLNNIPAPIVIFDNFPNSSAYPSKHLRFNSDYSRIYTAQGSPCDHCIITFSANPPSYSGTVVSFLKNGSDLITESFGVRDVIGLTFNPNVMNELWFTDTNRNGLGNGPPSELNQLSNANEVPNAPPNYGFPYCYGKNFSDTTVNGTCLPSYVGAQYLITSHSLPLGLTFVNGSAFPTGTVLIAERGNNSVPYVGFRVVMFNINNAASTETVFVDGWIQNSTTIIGRPVDVVQMKDGSILVSDEQAGAIIRFYYTPPSPNPAAVPTKSPSPNPVAVPTKSPSPNPATVPTNSPSPNPVAGPTSPSNPVAGPTSPSNPVAGPTSPSNPVAGPTSPSGGRSLSSLQNWLILLVCTIAILTFV